MVNSKFIVYIKYLVTVLSPLINKHLVIARGVHMVNSKLIVHIKYLVTVPPCSLKDLVNVYIFGKLILILKQLVTVPKPKILIF